mmetsp:Transcript_47712/g.54950  ORF Transcript_47712/g.54950 Transcript_47712/m.54950 type:complete len:82 (-) Transcript_47712:525-770(-)
METISGDFFLRSLVVVVLCVAQEKKRAKNQNENDLFSTERQAVLSERKRSHKRETFQKTTLKLGSKDNDKKKAIPDKSKIN